MPRKKTPKYMQGNSVSAEKVYIKKKIEAKSPNQRRYIKSIRSNDVTFCNGPAGSGKTHLAVAMAIDFLTKGLAVSYTHLTLPTIYSV